MEELYQLIKERTERITEVVKTQISSDRFKILKEEEKVRVERENFILSMMKANKSVQAISKNIYIKYSYEIMTKINPEFIYQLDYKRLEDNFLNDFVGLYRHFFHNYEEMFNFKLKIQNLIRPTNHNLIIDLVRYLVDFSRDYYQQTFFWYMKNNNAKIDRIEEEESKDLQSTESKQIINSKKLSKGSINEVISKRQLLKKGEESDKINFQKDPQKMYDVLDITGFPPLSSQPKDFTTNVEVLKIRINQFYRDIKSRNLLARTNLSAYYSKYHGQGPNHKQKQYLEKQHQAMNRATHPFRMNLIIQKNGFNFIGVIYSDSKNYVKASEKKLSPLKISQRLLPSMDMHPKLGFMLTSLKVIRISDNFLPPLIQKQSLPNTPNRSEKITFPFNDNPRINLISSNSAVNDQEIQRKIKKHSQYQIMESAPGILDKKIVFKDKSYRKLNDLKKTFKSEQKREVNFNINGAIDPQKKIFDWLQKLRQVKEIQRRKIMGLV